MSENSHVVMGREDPPEDQGRKHQTAPKDAPEKDEGSESESNTTDVNERVPLDQRSREDLYELAFFHYDDFQENGRIDDIDKAIEYGARAIELTPKGHSEMPDRLTSLGEFYTDRYHRLGEVDDLEKALECDSLALKLTPVGHPDLPDRFAYLAVSHKDRYERLGEVDDLQKSLEYRSRAVELTPDGHPKLPHWLDKLAGCYADRYRQLGEVDDLEKALETRSRALELTPDGHPDLPDRLANLALPYSERYRRLGEVDDLEKALENRTRALKLIPDDHSDFPDRFADLSLSYSERYRRLGEVDDLHRSLEYQSRAVELTLDGHPDLPDRLGNLAVVYTDRYRLLGDIDDLYKSLEYKSRALELTPDGHPDLPDRLENLAASYGNRYQRLGEVDDLHKSLEYISRAVELTPDSHPDFLDRLGNLAASYTAQYRLLGGIDDLEKALKCNYRALMLTPEGHPRLPSRLADLSGSYTNRYQHLGEADDLEKSLEYDSRAVELTPDGHPDLPGRLANLAVSFGERYRRLGPSEKNGMAISTISLRIFSLMLGKVDDLEKALETRSRALELTPDDHPDLPDRLASLSVSYTDRYQLLDEAHDLEKALEYESRAVELTPDDHLKLPNRLANLAASYPLQYELSGEADDIGKSLEYNSRALTLTPDTHPEFSMRHFNRAVTYIHQYNHTGDPSHLDRSLDSFRIASHSIASPPRDRFRYAFAWARWAAEYTSLNPIEAYQATIDLLSQFIWLGATTTQRYYDLTLAENLAVRAASVAILNSDSKLALEWLEHTRCIVWNQSVMLRSPLGLLESSHPELAVRIQTVAAQLHHSGSGLSGLQAPVSGSDGLENRYRLTREYNDLISQVRTLPGFEGFLRPINADGLARAARYGPIVIINCHDDRCNALVILPGSNNVQHLPLPNFTETKARRANTEMEISLQRKGLRERGIRFPQRAEPDFNFQFQCVLMTIWTGIVKPVLDFLGYSNCVSSNNLPHITWCPTGAVSFLPLHAAGDYDQPSSRAFDYVISSYTPTLTAFLATTPNILNRDSRVLAIGQEATLGHNSLPGTTKELAYLKAHVENIAEYTQLIGNQATTAATLDAMQQHDWVHLACHAHQNASDPTKSGFFLHDGTLDLAEINQRSLKSKGLAFLSACQTARGDEKLPDEAIHLASGMLMAGYTSVIATMWSVNDADAPLVADQVYRKLMKEGRVGAGEAGRALHHAVAELRDKVGEKEFGRWVPYIHIGS